VKKGVGRAADWRLRLRSNGPDPELTGRDWLEEDGCQVADDRSNGWLAVEDD
jgi:hypothetical protein